jgi:hypothetical protein
VQERASQQKLVTNTAAAEAEVEHVAIAMKRDLEAWKRNIETADSAAKNLKVAILFLALMLKRGKMPKM